MAWTAPKTWTVGEVLTAANMNAQVRDNSIMLAAISKPSAKAASNSTQSISTGVSRSIDLGSETWDYGGMHVSGSSSHRLTVPTGGDGIYRVGGAATWNTGNAASAADMRSMGVEVNSSDGGAGSFACRNAGVPGSTSVRMRQSAMGVHEYNAGDYFCLTVFNGSTTAQTVTPNSADNPVNLWAVWDSA